MPSGAPPRVAVVHDWLTGMRGGERVLESILRVVPNAEIRTLVHREGAVSPLIEARPIRRSIVQRLPAPTRLYRHYLPFFPTAVELFDLDSVDLVISTSHCAAKSVVKPGRAMHVCYCHSPMRYGWDQFDAYFGEERLGKLGSAAARSVMARLARWDRETAARVDRFVANSRHVASRIARYYNRGSSVLYPPVDTDFFTPGPAAATGYFLVVSALVPYKHVDRAIAAAGRLGAPMKVVGTGPDEARLRAMAGSSVELLGAVDQDVLRDLYRGASAVVLPGEEDFGIVPVEGMACGRPVVALGRGGATETVVEGLTGRLVADASVESLSGAMRAVADAPADRAAIRVHAERFGRDRFEQEFAGVVADALAGRG